ncbi:hypothetical protein B0J12DRAFT_641359 [Macrophomina phaseolina]|uniref:Uncharacterized protein n=1 Tax=Macrophomina phaseolina TaxID=35725 RepID=A0ABQ8GRF8_9PEZI|nr:hypothetical protein B0J12DRAFT_641359 [Macrophomina phaseolina]
MNVARFMWICQIRSRHVCFTTAKCRLKASLLFNVAESTPKPLRHQPASSTTLHTNPLCISLLASKHPTLLQQPWPKPKPAFSPSAATTTRSSRSGCPSSPLAGPASPQSTGICATLPTSPISTTACQSCPPASPPTTPRPRSTTPTLRRSHHSTPAPSPFTSSGA